MFFILVCSSRSYADFQWRCSSDEFHGDIEIHESMASGFLYQVDEERSSSTETNMIQTPLEFVVTPVRSGASSFDIRLKGENTQSKGRLSALTRSGFIVIKLKEVKYLFGCELVPLPVGTSSDQNSLAAS